MPGGVAAERSRLEAQMLKAGARLLAAQVAVQRGRFLLEEGQADEATRMFVSAVLSLDAVPFTLDDAGRRERWSAAVSEAIDARSSGRPPRKAAPACSPR